MRRVVVVASASGNGKTTVARELAHRLDVPFVEMDSLVHGPGWVEATGEELRAKVEPILAGEGWVVDNAYRRKLGTLLFDRADVVVWLDQPMRIWLPRLVRRTWRRIRGREEIWNGNRESVKTALWGRESLFMWAFRSHFRAQREWPAVLAPYRVVRLRSPEEVDTWLARFG